jgi:hypothetical protein
MIGINRNQRFDPEQSSRPVAVRRNINTMEDGVRWRVNLRANELRLLARRSIVPHCLHCCAVTLPRSQHFAPYLLAAEGPPIELEIS